MFYLGKRRTRFALEGIRLRLDPMLTEPKTTVSGRDSWCQNKKFLSVLFILLPVVLSLYKSTQLRFVPVYFSICCSM